MTTQDIELIQTITKAVENFNNSPWIDFGEPMDVRDCIVRAVDVGTTIVLEEIRREDIRLFHKEEAACGML